MRNACRILLTLAIAASATFAGAAPAGATECTPKGCTGGCKLGDPRDASIDPETLRIELPQPIRCTS